MNGMAGGGGGGDRFTPRRERSPREDSRKLHGHLDCSPDPHWLPCGGTFQKPGKGVASLQGLAQPSTDSEQRKSDLPTYAHTR